MTSLDDVMPRPSTVRSLCLLIAAGGLIVLYVNDYVIAQASLKSCAFDSHAITDDTAQRHLRRRSDDVINATSSDSRADTSAWDYNWDLLDGETKDSSHVAERTLVLVRHGQYDLSTGQLTTLGREQAAMTGRRLKEANLSYSEIVHSTLDRATQTAHIISSYLVHVPVRADDLLVEGGPVPPLPTITYWHLPAKTYHVDGPRLEAAFRKYFYRGDASLTRPTFQILVAHGNIFRFFTLRALQLRKNAWMRMFIAHASITMLHIRADGTVSLSKLGDAGHFPLNKLTY